MNNIETYITLHRRRTKEGAVLVLPLLLLMLFLLSSCSSTRHTYKGLDIDALASAQVRLGLEMSLPKDAETGQLYIEAARWLGVPYRMGGNDMSGVDCSGLNKNIYNNVYGITLHRRSIEQYELDCKKVRKGKLRPGNLVFFATGTNNPTTSAINHTGIYLEDGKFVHASSSRGVVVDRLDSKYFRDCWVSGGKVKE